MKLRPLQVTDIELVAGWLADPANYQWLDFGVGSPVITPALLRIMMQKDLHLLRVYGPPDGDTPIGLVAFSDINRRFCTAMLWYVLGNRAFAGQGHTSRAVANLLRLGFEELGLEAIWAWAVEENQASIRILQGNGFRYVGRQRNCHAINGRRVDRLLFDLVISDPRKECDVSTQ